MSWSDLGVTSVPEVYLFWGYVVALLIMSVWALMARNKVVPVRCALVCIAGLVSIYFCELAIPVIIALAPVALACDRWMNPLRYAS